MKMNRKDYLNELSRCIQALPIEEQTEAMNYYQNYFDDAGDDQKVIDELGDPQKLAEEIKAKFACVPAKANYKNNNNQNCNTSAAIKSTFDEYSVKNLDLSFSAAQVVMKSGNCYAVETRGVDPSSFRCELSQRGTLVVNNTCAPWNISNYKNLRHPRILLTVPARPELDTVKIKLAAGSFKTRGISLRCNTGVLNVCAGNLVVDSIFGGSISINCGMGNIQMNGTATGVSNINCGVGNITLNLTGNKEDYSLDAKIGIGAVKFNSERKSGLGDSICTSRKANHFSVSCSLGNVNILMK